MDYSPFIDDNGNRLNLEDIKFEHILKIKDNGIEEGYKVEFKSEWNDTFKKKHLCKTITAFANAEGGWLLIGINDDRSYIGIEKERTDFSQTISQMLAVSVNPIPKFDCRFICEQENNKRGVLIIYIYEGINPPYVWNGTIYTRSGSSKIPIKSDRSTIDELLNKGKKFEKKYSEFCVNKFVGEKDSFPYCTIYLYNPYNKIKYDTYGDDANKIKCDLRDINGNEVRIMDSINSVIRKQSDIINATTLTCMEEYFLNDNIKVFCPLFVLDNHNDIDLWVNTVADYNKNINMQDMTIVEGMLNYISMHNTLTNIFKYIKKRGKNICDYNITFEYKNMKNVVFYYNHIRDTQEHKDRFIQSIKDGNIYLCPISEVRTAPLFFLDENEDYELYAMSILEMNYLRLFGINNEIFNDILDNVGDKYNNILFSSDIYKI